MAHQHAAHATLASAPLLAGETLYVGVDIGKAKHVAGFLSSTLLQRHDRFEGCPTLSFEQSREGFRTFVDRLQAYVPLEQVQVLLEHTGHYHRLLEQYLLELDITVYRIHVQKRASGMLKTDKRDALGLANTLYTQLALGAQVADKLHLVRRIVPPIKAAAQLRSLMQHRYELAHTSTQYKNKLTAICDELFPELIHIFHDPNLPTALLFREQFPTPRAVAAASMVALQSVRSRNFPSDAQLIELQRFATETIGIKDLDRQRGLVFEQGLLIRELRLIQEHLLLLQTTMTHIVASCREGQILLSIPPTGPIQAATIIATVGNIANFAKASELKSYFGWAPYGARVNQTHEPTLIGLAQELLRSFMGEEAASELLELLGVSVITCVLDANVIIRDVSRYLLTKEPTGLLIAAKLGGARFFAATSVRTEVVEHLGGVTSRHGVNEEEALSAWNREYVPLITFLEPSSMKVLSAKATAVQKIDPDDVSTGLIIELIKPSLALSEDKSLVPYGVVRKEWTQVTVAFRDKSQRDANFVAIHVGGGITIWITATAIQALVALILKADKRIILGAAVALVLGAGIAIAHPPSRGWLKEKAEILFTIGSEQVGERITSVLETLISMDEQAKRAQSFISEKRLNHAPPQHVRDHIFSALSESQTPLTAGEIARVVKRNGYTPRGERLDRSWPKCCTKNQLTSRYKGRDDGV